MKRIWCKNFSLDDAMAITIVVALLATLAGPALILRDHARSKTCMEHLKAIGYATICYTEDYDGTLYPFGGPTLKLGMRPLRDALRKYVKNDLTWKCPSDNGPADDNFHSSSYYTNGASYLFNGNIYATAPVNTPKRLCTCRDLRQLVLYWDLNSHFKKDVLSRETARSTRQYVVYGDGLVSGLSCEELIHAVNVTGTLW